MVAVEGVYDRVALHPLELAETLNRVDVDPCTLGIPDADEPPTAGFPALFDEHGAGTDLPADRGAARGR